MKRLGNNSRRASVWASSGVLLVFFVLGTADAQEAAAPAWLSGRGGAIGSDFAAMRAEALRNARVDALRKAGVEIRAMELSVTTESSTALTDFYSKFAESTTRGLILEERILHVSDPARVPGIEQFRIEMEISALVGIQTGEPDAGFEVILETGRLAYREGEPVVLSVLSSRDGFLTVFDIYDDSLSVVFPNSLDSDNRVVRNEKVTVPRTDLYSISLVPSAGKEHSEEVFVAVVTKDDVPFVMPTHPDIRGDRLMVRRDLLTSFAKWLYKIPTDRRSSDAQAVQAFRNPE